MTDRSPGERGIYLTLHRMIGAPVETVYAAWTDPEQLRRWFAPDDAVVARAIAETRIGGRFLIEMRGRDGGKWVTRGLYREVVPNRRLVHTWCWEGSTSGSGSHHGAIIPKTTNPKAMANGSPTCWTISTFEILRCS